MAVQVGVLKDYQLDRFRAFYDPAADPKGAATTPAGADRDRLGRGRRPGAVRGRADPGPVRPAQQTDFIFTVAGEELGFVGAARAGRCCSGIVLWRACRIALRAEDLFGRLVATGVVCWFAFQASRTSG